MSPSTRRRFGRLDAAELERYLECHAQLTLLDARDATHFARGHLPGAVRLDGRNHEQLLLSAPRQQPVVIYCYHGNASQTYAQMFADFGFAEVHDLIGGFDAWLCHCARQADAAPALPAALAGWLAAHGHDGVHHRGAHGNTPLMEAAWRGERDVAAALLEHGAVADATNMDGNNALWLACVHGDVELVALLARAGVPIDHRNDNGATALMYAASAGKHAVVRALLDLGADPGVRSLDDFTALDMAASIECLQLLRHMTAALRT